MAAAENGDDAAATDPDLLARFEAACRRATERHANRQAIEEARSRLEGVAQQAESAAAAEPFDEQAWKSATSEWTSLLALTETADPAVAQRYADAEARVAQRAPSVRPPRSASSGSRSSAPAADRARREPRRGGRPDAFAKPIG